MDGVLPFCSKQSNGTKKGQMFFIVAIFMIVGFVLLRQLLTLPEITQEKVDQDTNLLDRNMVNINNEMAYMISSASIQAEPNRTGAEYLYNFSGYLRGQLDIGMLYVVIFSDNKTGNFSAVVGNFMHGYINGTLDFTDTSAVLALNDTGNATFRFNSSYSIVNVTLNYTLDGTRAVDRFGFNSTPSNYVSAFFDTTLKGKGIILRTKNIYNRTW